jgi:hypothetical protein
MVEQALVEPPVEEPGGSQLPVLGSHTQFAPG